MAHGGSWTSTTFGSDTLQLLIKSRFDRTGYDIQLTDLSRIWGETLSKQDVVTRALESGCSFNPGEDDGNYDTFVKCIKSSLNGDVKTTSTIRAGDPGTLFLDLSTPLSGGLSDLRWTVRLQQLCETAVATEIVGPLLSQANRLQHQIQQLVDVISSKDHVIQKITDHLENTSSDLTAVFPGVSNIKTSRRKHQSQRSHLAGHVKGLADFDEVAWRASNKQSHEENGVVPDVVNAVLGDLPSPMQDEKSAEDWVQNLNSRSRGSQRQSQVSVRPHSVGVQASKSDIQDEDFQRQDTPPQQSRHGREKQDTFAREIAFQTSQPAHVGEDSETEDEDEDCLDIPPTTSQRQALSTTESPGHTIDLNDQSTTGLAGTSRSPAQSGDTGTKRQQSPPDDLDEETEVSTSPSPVAKPQLRKETHDSDSEPKPEDKSRRGGLGKFGGIKAKNEARAMDREEQTEQLSARPKGSLGKFGGKKAPPSVSSPEAKTSTAPAKPKSSLGKFGGESKGARIPSKQEPHQDMPEASANARDVKKSTKTEPEVEQPPERELTEEEKQQRADEKREKLKRELAAKAKGPAKKKRKF